jgi:hypothetical protein
LGDFQGSVRPSLGLCLSEALARNLHWPVIYRDVLGEGSGAWHDAPRYPDVAVNCLTWLQLVLAEAYAARLLRAPLDVLDSLRYYHGVVGFSTRKHYTDQWLFLDPGPIRPLVGYACTPDAVTVGHLNPRMLTLSRGFDSELLAASLTSLEVPYYTPYRLRQLFAGTPERFAVLFGVPSKAYLERYIDVSGPFTLAHAVLVARVSVGLESTVLGKWQAYHASTAAGRVVSEPLALFLERCSGNYIGYVACRLDADWAAELTASKELWREMAKLVRAEGKIPRAASGSGIGFF